MAFRLPVRSIGSLGLLMRPMDKATVVARPNFVTLPRTYHAITQSSTTAPMVTSMVNRQKFSTQITADNMPIADFDEIIDLPNHPEKLLIDVREIKEVAGTGSVPTSLNIPLGEIENALKMSPENFQKRYGRPKPTEDTKIIFHCQAGIRSAKATLTAANLGYKNIKNYRGSWQEYSTKMGLDNSTKP